MNVYLHFLYRINWTTSSDLVTKSPTLHPIIPWITYSHLPNTQLLLACLNSCLFYNLGKYFPLYYVLKKITWVSHVALPINYSRTSLRYYTLLSHRWLTVFTTSHMCDIWPCTFVDITIILLYILETSYWEGGIRILNFWPYNQSH